MRAISLAVTTLCILLTVSTALAKDKKPGKQMDQQAMMELYKQLGTPGEPHKLFASLAGSWTTTTKEWMEPGKPPTESTGSAEMKMLLDGRFLYQEYNAQMMGQPFSGIGIDAYDNLRKRYVTAWIDTMGTSIFLMEGTASADGKTITLLDISKPKGNHLLDRVEELLRERAHPGAIVRQKKPTYARPAPDDLRQEILERSDAVIEALAD